MHVSYIPNSSFFQVDPDPSQDIRAQRAPKLGAVAAAYGLPADASESDILAKLLALNLERSGAG